MWEREKKLLNYRKEKEDEKREKEREEEEEMQRVLREKEEGKRLDLEAFLEKQKEYNLRRLEHINQLSLEQLN